MKIQHVSGGHALHVYNVVSVFIITTVLLLVKYKKFLQ